ncbi:MAG TPA: sulfotransferase, partial [Acidimicrobiia bacterium]|nr:sulfotransferase [Acidimicrobiia bacterium]
MGDDVGAPVLVVGHERSGTTWVGRVLASTPGTSYLGEPDHPRLGAFANRAVQGLGSHPVLGAADPAPADYARLWDVAFGAPVRIVRGQGRLSAALFAGTSDDERFAASHPLHPRVTARLRAAQITAVPRNRAGDFSSRIVKSVRAQLALDWICARWSPTVVVCRRHPLDVVASALAVDIESGLDWLAPAAHARARVF